MKLNVSKVIFITLVVTTIISVATMYYRFYVLKDFEIFFDDYGESESEEISEDAESEEISEETDKSLEATEAGIDESEIIQDETE